MSAIISLNGKVDPSLKAAITAAEKQISNLGKRASSGMAGAAKSIGSSLGSAIATGVKTAAATAGAALVGIGASAVSQYATYEQMVGGVETLFKGSARLVQQYAADAYKTAGVSANTYMEQATSFSASLIQSLGGDTQAAANYADLAIRDMSDNANKMGTDIQTIQGTYQSLMRGNYAMLDNLKLGYGGTKSELERLVSDAEQLTGQALDPSKFSDVITAIHAVQENLGITGTTALEAATTIEGSVNTMKAAWSNWLTGLGTEGADMGALTDQLVQSVGNVANNLAPVVGRIGQSLASSLPGALTGAWNAAVGALGNMGIQLPTIDTSQIQGAIQGVMNVFNQLRTAIGPVVSGIATTLQAVMPSVSSGIQGLVSSIAPAVQILTTSLGPALSNFATAVIPPLMSAISGIVPLLASIANAILPPIINFLTPIISLVMQIASAVIPPLTAAIQALTPVIQAVITVVMTIASVFSGFVGIVRTATGPLQAVMSGVEAVKGAFSTLSGPINTAMGLFNAIGGAISSVAGFLGNVVSMASQAASALASIGGGIVGGIGSLLGFRTGGFTTGPYIAGEDPRYPNEAVISFNPAYRAQNLRYWAMAGHMLGASPTVQAAAVSSGGGSTTIDMSGMTFAPNVEVRGNASKDDIVAAIRQCEAEFVDFVGDALARRAEAAYAV